MSPAARPRRTWPEFIVGSLQWLLLAALVALLIGFYRFHRTAAAFHAGPTEKADGIVVLTGDKGRIGAGVALLKAGKGKRLLISGVNAEVPEATLRKLYADEPGLTDRIDFGPVAANTVGNARETRAWAEKHQYRSLIVVTHDYHMARALAIFTSEMPKMALYPHAVQSRASFPFWIREYLKYLTAEVAPGLARDGIVKLRRQEPAHAT